MSLRPWEFDSSLHALPRLFNSGTIEPTRTDHALCGPNQANVGLNVEVFLDDKAVFRHHPSSHHDCGAALVEIFRRRHRACRGFATILFVYFLGDSSVGGEHHLRLIALWKSTWLQRGSDSWHVDPLFPYLQLIYATPPTSRPGRREERSKHCYPHQTVRQDRGARNAGGSLSSPWEVAGLKQGVLGAVPSHHCRL